MNSFFGSGLLVKPRRPIVDFITQVSFSTWLLRKLFVGLNFMS